jgi:hypothetical protein
MNSSNNSSYWSHNIDSSSIDDVNFEKHLDEEFQQIFMHIISQSNKHNTYKFALARFLLEYVENKNEIKIQVAFKEIAKYFLKYYWPQICNSKLVQGGKDAQNQRGKGQSEIVNILKTEFPEPYYHQTFEQMWIKENEKMIKTIDLIEKQCLKIVTFAFQRIKKGNENLDKSPMFFAYKITGKKLSKPGHVYVDLEYGIILNPVAIDYLKRHNTLLKNTVLLEWAKFLEPYNIGYPKIIHSIESEYESRNLTKERKLLDQIEKKCFYCDEHASDKLEVEHVIPYSYLKHNKMWNLTLACKKCNCKKLGSLPKPKRKWMNELHARNIKFRNSDSDCGKELDKHLKELGDNFEMRMDIMYDQSMNQGFIGKKMP